MQKQIIKYGYTFQAKVIAGLLVDKEFASRMYEILSPDYFESEPMGWLCKVIFEYFEQYHILPTMDALVYKIEHIDNVLLKDEVISALQTAWDSIDSTDIQFVKERTLDMCKEQELKFAIYDSVEFINRGQVDQVKSRIEDALKKGEDQNLGYNYLDDIDLRYEDLARSPIATGWQVIDDLLEGGLSPGELGVIMGPGGSGKSWLLTTICVNALRAGRRVLFVTLELSDTYVGVRHDMVVTNMTTKELKYNRAALKEQLSTLVGNLTIKWFSTKSLSIIKLRALIDRFKLMDQMPEILILDYADLMKLNTNNNKRKDEVLQELYEELRGLAGEYNIPVWTATQTTRESNKDDVTHIGADMIAESMGKHYTSDFMMSLARNADDRRLNTAKFYVVKNRFGKDGLLLYGKMDTERGKIEIYKNKSKESQTIEKLLVEKNIDIGNKYSELMYEEL